MTLQANLEEFADAVADECNALRTLINGDEANLNDLVTVAKGNLVLAVNELHALIEVNSSGINDAATVTNATWSSQKISTEIAAALDAVLDGAPGALDTLQEIAAALGGDGNFAANVTAALNARVRWDIDNQGLTDPQKLNARTNIGAASSVAVGDTDVDFVALLNSGLL
jgi:hypothetical protein